MDENEKDKDTLLMYVTIVEIKMRLSGNERIKILMIGYVDRVRASSWT